MSIVCAMTERSSPMRFEVKLGGKQVFPSRNVMIVSIHRRISEEQYTPYCEVSARAEGRGVLCCRRCQQSHNMVNLMLRKHSSNL